MTSPDGLVVRPVRWVDDVVDAGDLADVTRLYREYELDRIGSVDSEPAGLAAAYAWPQVLRDETALVYDGDEAVASVWVKAEEPTHDVFVDLAVAPGGHERERLESAVRHGIGAGRRHAERHPESSWTLRITVWSGDAVAAEVVEAHGLTPSRRFYRMRIDADSPAIPATAPPLPPGVELVVRDEVETRRTMWAVDNESFLDHYNFAPSEYDDWWAEWEADALRDPSGWWLLTVDGDPAAICILDETRAEQNDGYVSILGVRKPYRGRGLATLLLQRAFVRERDRGRAGIQLSVDAENTTGAVGLYERVGMRPTQVLQGYSRAL